MEIPGAHIKVKEKTKAHHMLDHPAKLGPTYNGTLVKYKAI